MSKSLYDHYCPLSKLKKIVRNYISKESSFSPSSMLCDWPFNKVPPRPVCLTLRLFIALTTLPDVVCVQPVQIILYPRPGDLAERCCSAAGEPFIGRDDQALVGVVSEDQVIMKPLPTQATDPYSL